MIICDKNKHPGKGPKGIYYQLNEGLKQVNTPYFSYFSSNDIMKPTKLYNEIQKIKTKLQSKGSLEYSFSHFDLETEIFYGNVKKAKLSKSNWIKKSSYSSSRMPTVMKKIVDIAV